MVDAVQYILLRALAKCEGALGPSHKSNLATINNFGISYQGQDQYEEAEQMYDLAPSGKEEALGPKHMSTLDTVNNLGLLYADQGKLEEAEQMYDRALAREEEQ